MKMTTNQESTPKSVPTSKSRSKRKLITKPGFENDAFQPPDKIKNRGTLSMDSSSNNTCSTNDNDRDNARSDGNLSANCNSTRPTEYLCDFADLLKCHLCKGYLIDAISLAECTHNFCRSCIIKYLEQEDETSCPKCQKEIHKTRPKQCVRTDTVLQEIVYKLVPNLYKNEMLRRKEFYKNIPDIAKTLSKEDIGESCERLIISPGEHIQLTVEYFPEVKCPYNQTNHPLQSTNTTMNRFVTMSAEEFKRFDLTIKRYYKCPSEMKVSSLVNLFRKIYRLDPRVKIEFFFKQELLKQSLKMIDLAYIYSSNSRAPIPLYFIVIEPNKTIEDYLKKCSLSESEFVPPNQIKSGIKRKCSTNSDDVKATATTTAASTTTGNKTAIQATAAAPTTNGNKSTIPTMTTSSSSTTTKSLPSSSSSSFTNSKPATKGSSKTLPTQNNCGTLSKKAKVTNLVKTNVTKKANIQENKQHSKPTANNDTKNNNKRNNKKQKPIALKETKEDIKKTVKPFIKNDENAVACSTSSMMKTTPATPTETMLSVIKATTVPNIQLTNSSNEDKKKKTLVAQEPVKMAFIPILPQPVKNVVVPSNSDSIPKDSIDCDSSDTDISESSLCIDLDDASKQQTTATNLPVNNKLSVVDNKPIEKTVNSSQLSFSNGSQQQTQPNNPIKNNHPAAASAVEITISKLDLTSPLTILTTKETQNLIKTEKENISISPNSFYNHKYYDVTKNDHQFLSKDDADKNLQNIPQAQQQPLPNPQINSNKDDQVIKDNADVSMTMIKSPIENNHVISNRLTVDCGPELSATSAPTATVSSAAIAFTSSCSSSSSSTNITTTTVNATIQQAQSTVTTNSVSSSHDSKNPDNQSNLSLTPSTTILNTFLLSNISNSPKLSNES